MITVAHLLRKPLSESTVANNLLKWGLIYRSATTNKTRNEDDTTHSALTRRRRRG